MEKKITELNKLAEFFNSNPVLQLPVKLAVIIALTFIAYFVVRKFLQTLDFIAREKTRWEIDEKLITALKKPAKRLIVLVGLNFIAASFYAYTGPEFAKYSSGIFYLLIIAQIALTLMRMVSLAAAAYLSRYFDNRISGTKEEFYPLLIRVTKLVIFFIALIIVLKHFNQDVQSLVVSLGVGSLAIALAAQETLSNMIAGFVIMTDRPFRVGDRIQLSSGEKGDVYEIGLRSTKLMTFDNTLIILPNAEIIKGKVVNLTYPTPVTRVRVVVGVAYGSDIDKVKNILVEACRANANVLEDPPPIAYFLNFGDSSLDFQVTCFVPDWRLEWSTAEEIRLYIDKRFREEGVEIPFPQRTLWFANKPPDKKDSKDS